MLPRCDAVPSMAKANQNFAKAARIADKFGEAVISKNNKPKYKLIDLESYEDLELTDDEKIDIVARRLLEEYRPAFEELAK